MKIKIGKKIISDNKRCFIVAEISANHSGNFKKACSLIKEAKKAGADAVKLQTYTPDTITFNSTNKDFLIKKNTPWKKQKTLWNLYNKAQTPREWHPKLFSLARKIKIEIFSSPFDETAIDFLEKLGCPAYKIASQEINHIPLIAKAAKTGKPIILSTGLCSLKDINLAVRTIKKFKNNKIIILKCTSSYPSSANELNLLTLKDIKKRFKTISGFSDHTIDDTAALASVALGGKVLEKHIDLDQNKSVDRFFSTKSSNFKQMVKKIRLLESSLGKIDYNPSSLSKKKHFVGRRSIYTVKKLNKGEILTPENIKIIRPNYGLHPKYYYKILGKVVNKTLKAGVRLSIRDIKIN